MTQRSLCTQRRLHRSFYPQKLSHTDTFTHGSFYALKLLHADASIHRSFYTEKSLHGAFAKRSFLHAVFKRTRLCAPLMRSETLTQLAGNGSSWSTTLHLFLHLFDDVRVDLDFLCCFGPTGGLKGLVAILEGSMVFSFIFPFHVSAWHVSARRLNHRPQTLLSAGKANKQTQKLLHRGAFAHRTTSNSHFITHLCVRHARSPPQRVALRKPVFGCPGRLINKGEFRRT